MIQAGYLSEAGLYKESLELSDYLLSDFSQDAELSSIYLTRAKSFEALGQFDLAIEAFRNSLTAQRSRPNNRTNAWLEFGIFAITHGLEELYPEVKSVLDEFADDSALVFPKMRFEYLAVRAYLYEKSGEKPEAVSCAREAVEFAKATHSGFSRHPELGLVQDVNPQLMKGLNRLASEGSPRSTFRNLLDGFNFRRKN